MLFSFDTACPTQIYANHICLDYAAEKNVLCKKKNSLSNIKNFDTGSVLFICYMVITVQNMINIEICNAIENEK